MPMTSKLGTEDYAYTTLQVVWWFLGIYADNTGQFVPRWTKRLVLVSQPYSDES
jgi:hypothetical protein